MTTIVTDRLVLTPIGPEHTADLVQLHADPNVDRRSDGVLVGRGGLSLAVVDGTYGPELGWALLDSRRGHGFATEIGAAGLRWGFGARDYAEIVAFTEAHTRGPSWSGSVCSSPGSSGHRV